MLVFEKFDNVLCFGRQKWVFWNGNTKDHTSAKICKASSFKARLVGNKSVTSQGRYISLFIGFGTSELPDDMRIWLFVGTGVGVRKGNDLFASCACLRFPRNSCGAF